MSKRGWLNYGTRVGRRYRGRIDFFIFKGARQEDVGYIREMKVYAKVSISECWRKTGKRFTQVRWIDINKGDAKQPDYRSRRVAKEMNTYNRLDLSAATPPLEAVKFFLAMAATQTRGEVVMVNDASRVLFHAEVERDVYVDLPQDDRLPGDEAKCPKLGVFNVWHARCGHKLA